MPIQSAVDQVESLHAFTLQGQLMQTGVISAIHASLLAGSWLGKNLMWYRPEMGCSTIGDSEVDPSGWVIPLFLYFRQ
jgi:hypothetical protein